MSTGHTGCSRFKKIEDGVYVSPLPPYHHYCDDVSTNNILVNFFCTLFLFVCSIKCTAGGRPPSRRCILCCSQVEKVCRKSSHAQTNFTHGFISDDQEG